MGNNSPGGDVLQKPSLYSFKGKSIRVQRTNTIFRKMLLGMLMLLLYIESSYSQRTVNEINTLISRATTAVATKRVYLIKDYDIVVIPLHLVEIEAALDSLTYRLISLQYSTDVELAEPRLVLGQNYVSNNNGKYLANSVHTTIFGRVMTLFDANTICNRLGLRVLELDNMPHQLRVPEVLLHFEILVQDGIILCTSASMVKKGMDCVTYILDKTKHREFIRTASNLTRTLTSYKNNKFYIKATEESFLFTHANYGITGCSGDSTSREADANKGLQKDLHAQYFKALGGLYVSLYKNLNQYVEYMVEAVHQFSTETSMIPPKLVNDSMIIEGIVSLLPSYLPNLDMPRLKFSEFGKFFAEQSALSNDDVIAEFRDAAKLARFKTRQLKMIYSAAEQFNTNTRVRIAKFASHFVDLKSSTKIPNTWLIRRDQNVGTFIMLVNSIISSIDDHLLHEIYVIVNNRKTTLLRDLAPFASKQVDSNYLKHRELENQKKKGKNKVVRLPPTSATPLPEPMQGDEISYISNYERYLSNEDPRIERLFSDDILSSSTSNSVREVTTPLESTTVAIMPVQDAILNLLSPASSISSSSAEPTSITTTSYSSTEQTTSSGPPLAGATPETQSDPPSFPVIPPSFLLDPSDPAGEGSGVLTTTGLPRVVSLSTNSGDRNHPADVETSSSTISPDISTTEKQFETLEEIKQFYRNQANNRIQRQKRSGFWTKVFGIATSDDMVEAYKNEVDVAMREDAVEKGMAEARTKTNELLRNYKSMAIDLQKVESQEKKLFEYVDQIVRAETDSLKKLELLAKSIDRITIMSSEYQNLNLQTILLIHTIEKTHILIQSAITGNVDVAQLPADLLQMYNPNHLQTALSSTHVEFIYGKNGYAIKLRIPELTDPFVMYDIISLPIYIKNHWTTMNLKRNLIVNSVQDVLVHDSPLSTICEMGNDYYLCDPTEIVIRHSQNTCELDIISAVSDPQPKYMNCEFDSIKLKAEDQYALIVRGNLSISSMEDDELHYICQNPADSRVKTVKAGFSIHETVKGCVYETSKLTIYNGPEKTILKEYKDTDTELDILNALSTLETLLDEAIISDYSNTTNVETIVKQYEKVQKETEVTYEKLKSDIKIAQEVKQLGEYTPLKIDLRAPAQQSNWLTGTFWLAIVIFFLMLLGCTCRICPNCFPMLWKSISMCCIGYYYSIRTCMQGCCKPMETAASHEANAAEPFEIVHMLPQAPVRPSTSTAPATEIASLGLTDPNMLERNPSNAQPRYPNLESHYEETRPNHDWRITKGKYNEYLLTSLVPDGQGGLATVFFDIVSGQAIDQYNKPLQFISSPNENLIQIYRDKVRYSQPPAYLIENGIMYLPGAPHIIFSNETDHWINRVTKRIISGLSAPSRSQI